MDFIFRIFAGLSGHAQWQRGFVLLICFSVTGGKSLQAESPPTAVADGANHPAAGVETKAATEPPRFFVREYLVRGGGHLLPPVEVENSVYPFLGPYRTPDDVEQARAALEKAYRDKGYQTVSVQIPQQQVKKGVIVLQVFQGEVARLRVNGAHYVSLDEIKREAPSLREGATPDFNEVTRDLAALNNIQGRQVTPALRAGIVPGTVDVDLNVKDSLPLHGSLEINNRYSADTTPLRINGSASYDNLWQLGHSIGGSFQLSPEDLSQVKVFSGYYLARVPDMSWLSLMLTGTKQDSNVSTLGGIGVAGKGETVGLRAIFSLPAQKDFYHSVSLGIDRKHYEQDVLIAGTDTMTPVTYLPLSAAYSATWAAKGYETDANASVNAHFRGAGSSEQEFELNRHGADGSFIYFRGDLSHTRDLPEGMQIFAKAQGQASDKPLVNSEQFGGGGLGTARGYLEAEELGDNALFGSVELRSPSLSGLLSQRINEWRFYTFADGGILAIDDPLPEQTTGFTLASVGAGTRVRFSDHFNASLDMGIPISKGPQTNPYEPLLTFRAWAEF